MNGESVFGWLKVGAVGAIVLGVGALLYFVWKWISDKGGIAAASLSVGATLKNSTPLGIPARAIDSGISAATGRDETLGGWLAELFNPATRQLAKQLNTPGKGQRAEVTMASNTSYVDWQ